MTLNAISSSHGRGTRYEHLYVLDGESILTSEPVRDVSDCSTQTTDPFLDISHPTLPSDNALHRAIISKWRIGWKTPTLIIGLYFLAVCTALGHYLFLNSLDGKKADGIGSFPQSWATSISNLLANLFKALSSSALSIAFTQYLWRTLRTCTLKVSHIDTLHGIRNNPFLLADPSVVRVTPILFMTAALSWLLSIVIIYPPGSLTVGSRPFPTSQQVRVPNFDPSFIGNSSIYDASNKNLAAVDIYEWQYRYTRQSVLRFGQALLISGQISSYDSPCGPNCSYSTKFEGPIFNCSSWNVAIVSRPYAWDNTMDNMGMSIYNGDWDFPRDAHDFDSHFSFSLAQPMGYYPQKPWENGTLIQQISSMKCAPARALYTMNTMYNQNVRTIAYSTEYRDLLSIPILEGDFCIEFLCNTGAGPYEPREWPTASLEWYRNANLLALFDSMISSLVGNYSVYVVKGDQSDQPTAYELSNGDRGALYNCAASSTAQDNGVADYTEIYVASGPNKTIIANTYFNAEHDSFTAQLPRLTITPELLNAAIANITISAALHFGIWQTNTTATITTWHNVYLFSAPYNLILPYALSLLLTLVLLLLGANALRLNGVSAADSSFVQLLTTTTGDGAIRRAAAGGCLGGTENVPPALAQLSIRFGELRAHGGLVRRAGFGTEEEVAPLVRAATYGFGETDAKGRTGV